MGLLVSAGAATATAFAAWFAYSAYDAALQSVAAAQETVAETRRQANIAQDTYVAGTRPWIKVESFEPSDFTVRDTWLSLWVRIKVKNIGQTPAEGVFIVHKLLLPDLEADKVAEAVALCRKARDGELRPIFQTLVFPGETKGIQPPDGLVHFLRFSAEAAEARERMLNDWHANAKNIIGDEEAAAGRAEKASYPYRSFLTLAGCITYDSSTAPLVHQTAFLVDLHRKVPDASFGGAFDLSRPNAVPSGEIITGEPDFGASTHRRGEQGGR